MASADDEVTVDQTPTMDGFRWSPAPPFVPTVAGENGWCMRDAFCELFGWEPDSEEWHQFTVEGAAGHDLDRLAGHLSLTVYEVRGDWDRLVACMAHPGIALFVFPAYRMSHVVYVNDVRWLLLHWSTPGGPPTAQAELPSRPFGWPLGFQHLRRGPVLEAVIVDERQQPRSSASAT